jgi:hypothetical protein
LGTGRRLHLHHRVERNPPDSNYLRQKLGELCGSAFWVFLSQRFQMLHPEDERFAAEIENAIYNIGIANQDGAFGLRYHTILEGRKEKGFRVNTCCEGQGTRLLGSLPEHIYSLAADGLYLHLYEPSSIRWNQDGAALTLTVATRFPFDTAVTATLQTASPVRSRIRVRVPVWAAGPLELRVNGTPAGTGAPSRYVMLDRVWSDGDRIEFTLAPALLARRYTGADQLPGKARFSVEYGPILLAAVGASEVDLKVEPSAAPESLARLLDPVPGSPLHFNIRGNPGARLMPYWQIEGEVPHLADQNGRPLQDRAALDLPESRRGSRDRTGMGLPRLRGHDSFIPHRLLIHKRSPGLLPSMRTCS